MRRCRTLIGALVFVAMLLCGPRTEHLSAQAPAPIPGSAQVSPGESVYFVQQSPPGMRFPAAPPRLTVTNHGSVAATVSYAMAVLTVTVPVEAVVVILSGCFQEHLPAAAISCQRQADSQNCVSNPCPGVVFTTLPADAPVERVDLAPGCNNEASTWSDTTSVETIAALVFPQSALAAMWSFDSRRQQFTAFSRLPDAPNDLVAAPRLQPLFFCLSVPATLAKPRL